MAQEIVGVKIQVDNSEATKSIGSLKQQLREAQADVGKLADKFGATSKQAIEAAKRAADLKDRIGDAKALTDAFNPDAKFKAFGQALSGVAGGFAAVQGAIGLFGTKSEDVEKTLLKVQSALAFSQGIEQLGGLKDSLTNVAAVVKSQVVGAFTTLRGALIATGVGALAVGLGLLIANFETVKKVVLNLIPGLGKVADFIGNLVNKVTDFIGVTSEASRATAKLIEDNNKAIKDSERFLDLNADKYDEYTQRKFKANIEFLKSQKELAEQEEKGEINAQQRRIFEVQAREKANREIVKSDADRNEAIRAANKKAADEAEQQRKIRDAKIKEDNEKISKQYTELREKDVASLKEIQTNRIRSVESISPIVSGQLETQLNAIGARVSAETEAGKIVNELNKDATNSVIANEKAKQDAFAATGNALGALGQLVGQETAAGKALSAAQALINTYLGVTQVLANKTVIPEPFGTIQKVASIATILASGLSAVKNIGKTKVPGGGGGGIATPSIATAPISPASPQAALTQLNQQSINQLGSATNRAYVVESDITNSQERVTRINRAARLA